MSRLIQLEQMGNTRSRVLPYTTLSQQTSTQLINNPVYHAQDYHHEKPSAPPLPPVKQAFVKELSKPQEQEQPVCWICLQGDEDGEELTKPCKCPRWVHKECLAMWQKRNEGRAEEKKCRFCSQELPNWRSVINENRTPILHSVPGVVSSRNTNFPFIVQFGSRTLSTTVDYDNLELGISTVTLTATLMIRRENNTNRQIYWTVIAHGGSRFSFNDVSLSQITEVIDCIRVLIDSDISFTVECLIE